MNHSDSPIPVSTTPEFLSQESGKSSRLKNQGWVNAHRKLLFILLAPVFISYLMLVPAPSPLSHSMVLAAQVSGSLLVFAGFLGRLFATLTIGGHKDKTVVRTELYSICRNPLYFSSFLMAVGLGLLTCRMDFMLLVSAAYLGIFYPMMQGEARHLRDKLPDFASYEAEVPLFFPRPGLWQARKHIEINFHLVGRTCMDAAIVLMLIPAVMIVRMLIIGWS